MHISLSWSGAMGRTSFWTKRVYADDYGPCRPRDLNWGAEPRGGTADAVPVLPDGARRGQGRFDTATISALRHFEAAHRVPLSHSMGQTVWRVLLRTTR